MSANFCAQKLWFCVSFCAQKIYPGIEPKTKSKILISFKAIKIYCKKLSMRHQRNSRHSLSETKIKISVHRNWHKITISVHRNLLTQNHNFCAQKLTLKVSFLLQKLTQNHSLCAQNFFWHKITISVNKNWNIIT